MLNTIKNYLSEHNADAWVIYDFASSNPAFVKLFGNKFSTRKCYAIISKKAKPVVLCHLIDAPALMSSASSDLFEFKTFRTWQQLDELLESELNGFETVLMEISENGLMPRSSYVDYGTVCSIMRFVKNIASSADLFQQLTATFDGEALELHKKAALVIDDIKNRAFEKISSEIKQQGFADEWEIQQFILNEFKANDMVTDSNPIVAIGKNANSPHYEPTKETHSKIVKGDLVLIDLWAKFDRADAVFADVTWMGYAGSKIPKEIQNVFDIVKTAINNALDFLQRELPKRKVYGYEVDDICNKYITSCGYGQYIVHRTGHSISLGESDHGVGVNIDNFETHDTREIIDNIAFSLEPAIYTPEFGLREEINVYIQDRKPFVYTPRQEKIILL